MVEATVNDGKDVGERRFREKMRGIIVVKDPLISDPANTVFVDQLKTQFMKSVSCVQNLT